MCNFEDPPSLPAPGHAQIPHSKYGSSLPMGRIWLEKCDSRNQIWDWTEIAWKNESIGAINKKGLDSFICLFFLQLNPAQLANLGRLPSCYHSRYGLEFLRNAFFFFFENCGIKPLLEEVLGVAVTMSQDQWWDKSQSSGVLSAHRPTKPCTDPKWVPLGVLENPALHLNHPLNWN